MKRLTILFALLGAVILTKAQTSVRKSMDYGGEVYVVNNYSEESAKRYLSGNNLDPIEGIWISGIFKLSIEKDFNGSQRSGKRYRAIILHDGNLGWASDTNKKVYFFLEKTGQQKVFNATMYYFTAVWSHGERNYTIKPYSSFPSEYRLGRIKMEMITPTIISALVPTLNDNGKVDGSSTDMFYKVYPGVY